eukprot:12785545-Alexandrium_andersonii.AAC.1
MAPSRAPCGASTASSWAAASTTTSSRCAGRMWTTTSGSSQRGAMAGWRWTWATSGRCATTGTRRQSISVGASRVSGMPMSSTS